MRQSVAQLTSALPKALAFFPLAATLLMVTGCDALFSLAFTPGTYSGDIPCTIRANDGSGTAQSETFDSAIELVVAEDGAFTVNGEDIAVGEEITRSIPTADLAFEVTRIDRIGPFVTVRYAPRPTLPGITVTGSLTEHYDGHGDSVSLSANASLALTDVDTTILLTVTCEGTLDKELLP